MISFLPWLFISVLGSAHGATDPGQGELRAVRPSERRSKTAPKRTVEEWRRSRREARRKAAQEQRESGPSQGDPPSQLSGEDANPQPAADPNTAASDNQPAKAKAKAKATNHLRTSDSMEDTKVPFLRKHLREMYGLLALFTLWLIARIFGQTSADKNARKPPPRPSPVNIEELGRVVFNLGRSSDMDAYRALYLNGTEAMSTLGAKNADLYLANRSLPVLEAGLQRLTAQLPTGTSYVRAELNATHQCILHVANPDGTGREVAVGTVAQVGAVLRLVAPAPSTPHTAADLPLPNHEENPPY